MKISVFALAALAAATSSSCFVPAAAAAASRKGKNTKKVANGPNGATGPTDFNLIPIGDTCTTDDECAIPPGLEHGNCAGSDTKKTDPTCQSGQPGSLCFNPTHAMTSDDCVIQTGLTPPHAVCRKKKCQQ